MADEFGPPRDDRDHMFGRRCDRNQPCPAAQAGFPGQPHGARHAGCAPNNEYVAKIALVRGATAAR